MHDLLVSAQVACCLRELETKAREAASAAAQKLDSADQDRAAGKANGLRVAQAVVRDWLGPYLHEGQ